MSGRDETLLAPLRDRGTPSEPASFARERISTEAVSWWWRSRRSTSSATRPLMADAGRPVALTSAHRIRCSAHPVRADDPSGL